MKVAVIGNMNNNHFALMRHLRDLSVDAELLMYQNEPLHFHPQEDTWHWQRWAPFVKSLPVTNGGADALFGKPNKIAQCLEGYDAFIGNGISPVLFARMRKRLQVFIPYGDGVEFIIEHVFRWRHPRSTLISLYRKVAMERALQSSVDVIITANVHPHSMNTYRRLRVDPLLLPIPMLYPEPVPPVEQVPHLAKYIKRMRESDLVVFSHVAHIWKNLPVPHYMGGVGKRNNWLVEGFARFVKTTPRTTALLCLTDYGRDVPQTRQLIADLGIENHVLWLPQMSRREIMCLLPNADIGGSEFAGMYWGGCGWEFLASGTPMLHQLHDAESYARPDMPLPPFFNVNSPEEIAEVLRANDRKTLREIGGSCKRWFDTYQGPTLAKKYVELLAPDTLVVAKRSA